MDNVLEKAQDLIKNRRIDLKLVMLYNTNTDKFIKSGNIDPYIFTCRGVVEYLDQRTTTDNYKIIVIGTLTKDIKEAIFRNGQVFSVEGEFMENIYL